MGIAALWGLSFLAAYGLVYRSATHNEYLHEFWRYAFLEPWLPSFLSRVAFVRREVLTALSVGLHDPATSGPEIPDWFLQGQRWGTWLLALVGVIGAIAWARRRAAWEWVLLFGPVVLLGAAAVAGAYPASSRLVMFLAPAVTIAITAGLSLGLQGLHGRARWLATGSVVSIVFGAQLLMSVRYLLRCPTIENVREMVAVLDQSRDAPQIVYVHAGALPAWALYTTDWAHPDAARLARYAALGASDGPAFENAASRGRVAPGEGWQLRLTDGRRLELIGVPAGVWRRPHVPKAGRLDVGWVANEVDRIKRAARCQGGAWVLLSHANGQDRQLLQGLSEAGGRVGFRMTGLVASLTRFEFGPGTGDCQSW
jgi:hypothetical protein